jgi:type IV secretion system protein VirB10
MSENTPNANAGTPSSPLYNDSADFRKKRTSGQKIIIFVLLVVVIVLFFVIMAVNSERMLQRKEYRNTSVISDPTRLQSDLIAEAEAARYRAAESARPEAGAASQQQIVVVRQPPRTRKRPQTRQLTDIEHEDVRRYRTMKQTSLLSKSAVDGFENLGRTGSAYAAADRAAPAALPASGSAGQMRGSSDPNGQQHKLDFLTQEGAERTPQGYSANTRRAPLAPMELKAGTVIPGILLVGVNSDLPGSVIGQVSENVYDTATGNHLLVPQGTRIIGVYDAGVTHGQKRVGIVWNRLIYPDGSSLNIAGSPGTDLAGYSGIKGRVDNHYGQLLAAGLFTSFFTAAVDVASGNDRAIVTDDGSKSARDVLAETTAVTIAGIGSKMAERALDIPPTITVKPGSRFNVMVMEDVVFPESWESR